MNNSTVIFIPQVMRGYRTDTAFHMADAAFQKPGRIVYAVT